MKDVRSFQLATLIRTGKRIRSGLTRMRKNRARNPASRLSQLKHQRLVTELEGLRIHLNQLILATSADAKEDQELSDILGAAKQVLRDCDEMLELLL